MKLIQVVLANGSMIWFVLASRILQRKPSSNLAIYDRVDRSEISVSPDTTRDMAPCNNQSSGRRARSARLDAYLIEFAESPNVDRMSCQLRPSMDMTLEAAVKNTQEDFQNWMDQGLIARDHVLGGWNTSPVKYASVFMSHLNVWRKIAAAQEESWAGVFEGDTVLRDDFHEVLADLRFQLDTGALPAADIVYLGHCVNNDCATQEVLKTLVGDVSVVQSHMPVCSHAYLLSGRGAKILRDNAFPMRDQNDEIPMKSLVMEGKLNSLSLCPTIARQGGKHPSWMPEPLKWRMPRTRTTQALYHAIDRIGLWGLYRAMEGMGLWLPVAVALASAITLLSLRYHADAKRKKGKAAQSAV